MIHGMLAAGLCVWGADTSLLNLKPGDTITIVGGAAAERMQHFPYFEALLRESLPGTDIHRWCQLLPNLQQIRPATTQQLLPLVARLILPLPRWDL